MLRYTSNLSRRKSGFTIVELLIVIVVIAILATISIVAYNGIQNRAKTSAGQELASQIVKKLEAYNAVNGEYPITRAQLQGTPESAVDGMASGTTADEIPILLNANASLFGPPLTSSNHNNGQSVQIDGSAAGGNVYYWDFTLSTPAPASIPYGS